MDQQSVFFDDWLSSLREQYKYVLRQDDRVTLPSLTAVMLEAGFEQAELQALRDEVGAVIPEIDAPVESEVADPPPEDDGHIVAEASSEAVTETESVAEEAIDDAPDDVIEETPLTFDEGLALAESNETREPVADDGAEADEDDPAQMSMF